MAEISQYFHVFFVVKTSHITLIIQYFWYSIVFMSDMDISGIIY